jgi:hypothetical protein
MQNSDLILLLLLLPGAIIILLVVIVVFPRALRDETRLKNNLCLHCGYDLGQSTDRCPKCGCSTKPPAPPTENPHR